MTLFCFIEDIITHQKNRENLYKCFVNSCSIKYSKGQKYVAQHDVLLFRDLMAKMSY